MRILAIDTAAALCAACVLDTAAGERGRAVLDLGRGHAERLMEVIGAALEQAGCTYGDLDAIAVSTGPGSFTGVRVGVAAARGLALALKIPAMGVTTLEALAHQAQAMHPDRPVIVAIDAGRGQVYTTSFAADGAPLIAPAVVTVAEAQTLVRRSEAATVLAGSAAPALAEAAGPGRMVAAAAATADIGIYALLGAQRLSDPDAATARPKPLYLRSADAKPQTGFALPRKTTP